MLQRLLPHFTIRMIDKMEGLVQEGVFTMQEFNEWVDPDLYKEISKIIQQVVVAFKMTICDDKSVNKTIDQFIDRSITGSGSGTQAAQNPTSGAASGASTSQDTGVPSPESSTSSGEETVQETF